MFIRVALALCLLLTSAGSTLAARKKAVPRMEPVTTSTLPGSISDLRIDPDLMTADECTAKSYTEFAYYIPDWVIGIEWYKALIDPSQTCDSAYPFTITAVNMPMSFPSATDLVVSVDIEMIDYTTIPGCSSPGEMLTYSQEYEMQVPSGGGEYNIWIPLDTPVVVTGPFFAGFYISNELAEAASVYTDESPASCASYDVWDESIGWVDLVSDDPQFPGRLVMEVSGTPGGGGGGGGGEDPPDPPESTDAAIVIVAPAQDQTLYENTEMWVWDSAGSGALDFVSFSFSNGGPFVEFGRDYDGTVSFRNGVQSSTTSNGFSAPLDISILPEGVYQLRAIAVDTLGDSSTATISVTVDPTPPTPRFVGLSSGDPVCTPMTLQMTCPDEDLSYIEVYRKTASSIYSAGVTPISQFSVGDADGQPSDGNQAISGEFGDYYSAPVAAAMAARVWYDRGYADVLRSGTGFLTDLGLAEALAGMFRTRKCLGTYDDAVMGGIHEYFALQAPVMQFRHYRYPDYYLMRRMVEDEGRTAVLGLSGTPGMWVALDGFIGWRQTDGSFRIAVANPLTGAIQLATWRHRTGYSEIELGGVWHRVDIAITMLASDWNVTRTLVAADFTGSDGWSVNWVGNGINDGDVCFLRAIGRDVHNHRGTGSIVVERNCDLVYVNGDYNNDRTADAADLYYLIEYITQQGIPPVGGIQRADCNCDNVVNVADIVYYMNFLFGRVAEPCR